MKVFTALAGIIVVCCAGTATATNLSLQVTGPTTASPGETINIEIVGELNDAANEGLALFGVDMVVTGDVTVNLSSAATITAPGGGTMASFVSPDGLNNPMNCANCFGFGGTADGPAHDGNNLLQIGGGQNTIGNNVTYAPFPIGDVVLHLAVLGSPQVLAVGTLTLPSTPAEYDITIGLANGFANVIKDGEAGPTVYATEAVGTVNTTGLTVSVSGVAPQIVSVDSIRTHGSGVGDLAIDVSTGSQVEPRLGGIQKLEVVFDMAMDPEIGTIEITPTYSGTITPTLSPDGLTLTIGLAPALADMDCHTVGLLDMVSLGGQALAVDSFQVIGLAGDIDRGGVVTPGDASIIKPKFTQTATAANAQYDYDVSGVVTPGDFSQVKSKFGNQASCP